MITNQTKIINTQLNHKSDSRIKDIEDSGKGRKLNYTNYTNYTINTQSIALIRYLPYSGEVLLLFITDPAYAGLGLGTQLLHIAMKEMLQKHTKEVWAVTTDNHGYWSRLPGFKPRSPVHPSVTNNGYYKRLV